jgi:hypothetical protein
MENGLNKNEKQIDDDTENIEKPSYTYWKRESDKPFSNEFAPTKSDSNVAELTKTSSNNNFGSAWNTAGTWEEKHLSKSKLEEFFTNSFRNNKKNFDGFVLDNVSAYSGDVK